MKKNTILNDEEQRRIFSRNLNRYIRESGKQQKEIAKDLGFQPTTFNTWCMGKAMPTMGKVQALADYFGILKSDLLDDKDGSDSDLSEKDLAFLRKFKSLDDQGRSTVLYIMERESERVREIRSLEERNRELSMAAIPKRLLAYYGRIAAAGQSFPFEDMIAGTVEVELNEDSQNADFAIGVWGDSMEPTYTGEDIVYVQRATHINKGDIGIFRKDGSIYIKEVGEDGLISHNPKYKNIYGDVTVLGKVVGKVDGDYKLVH